MEALFLQLLPFLPSTSLRLDSTS